MIKKLNYIFSLLVLVLCLGTVSAQDVDKGVTSSGKEVDCSTIDPNDAVVNEKGQIVTSPRLTRNGKLITTECGFIVTVTGDNSAAFCDGNSKSVTYTATVPAEIAGDDVEYKWYVDDDQQTSTTNTMTFSYNAAGEYTVRCEVSKGVQNGIGSATTTITVYDLPTVIISGDFVVCHTTPVTLTTTSGYSSYAWSSNVSSSTGNTAQVVNAGTYTVTVTDANGCTNSASQEVTVSNPQVTGTVSISGTTSICYNSSTTLTANATASDDATLYYQWYKNNAIITGATNKELSTGDLTESTTYKCVVYAQQGDCKSDTKEATASVTVNHPVAGTETLTAGNSIVCAGGNTTLTASVTGNTGTLSYKWYKNGTAISGTSNTLSTGTLNETSTFKCEVTATVNGCTASTEKEVTVTVPEPTPGTISITTEPLVICYNSSATITATATNSEGTLSYKWYKDNALITGATSASYTTGNLTETATFKCEVTAEKDGCTLTKSANVTVSVIKPSVGTLSLTGGTICYEATKELQVTTSGNNGVLTYQWSTGGAAISGATSATYTTPNLTATTVYTVNVTATVNSPITCTATGSKTATVTVSQPVYDTLSLCSCQLSTHTFPHGLSFTEAEMNNQQPPIDTLTKTYAIGSCPAAGHYTVVLWDPDAPVAASTCENLHFFVNQRATEEIHNGSTLTGVKYNGYTYKVVEIAGQCWLKENLRTKFKPDGVTAIVPIRKNSDRTDTYYDYAGTQVLTSFCGNTNIDFTEYEKRFGLMYNWFTAMDNNNPAYGLTNYQGICPDGWHIPDTTEWQYMANSVGIEGEWTDPDFNHTSAPQISTGEHAVRLVTGCEWMSSNVASSPGDYDAIDRNSSGFSARPSGCWNNDPAPGVWFQLGQWAFFWSSTREYTGSSGSARVAAYNFDLHPDWAGLSRDRNDNDQSIGRSVRCIRDKENIIGITGTTSGEASATCSYQVAIDGQNGVCWSTSQNPTVADSHTDVASVAGTYTATLSPLAENTLYYARAYVMVDGNPVYSNQVTVTALSKPIVVTMPVTSYTSSATLKGNVTNDGGYANTVRGICWGTSENPTLSDNVLTDTGTGVGEYSVEATSLSAGVTYHCRAYATNAKGTVYGADVAFSVNTCTGTVADIEHSGSDTYHVYPIGQRGSYCWMLRSIRSAKLNDGTAISYVLNPKTSGYTPSSHTNSTTLYKPFTVWDANSQIVTFKEDHWTAYGYYYNYAAAKRVCPSGWHLPTLDEWNDLNTWAIQDYGCNGGAAKALAEADATWKTSTGSCHPGYNPSTTNDATGFMAFPCGYVGNGTHTRFNETVNFWVDSGGKQGYWVYLNYNEDTLKQDLRGNGTNTDSPSVACVIITNR